MTVLVLVWMLGTVPNVWCVNYIMEDLIDGAYETLFGQQPSEEQLEEIERQAKMNVPEQIEHNGYPVERHSVVTTDGYILTLFRIPFGRGVGMGVPNKQKREVVFLQPGLLCSSAVWITTGPDRAISYFLADQGYDVWMGNFRGTFYSRGHKSLNADVDVRSYWDFSWHEMGIVDLPEMIDYVLNKTDTKQLYHVGHSQGTTTFYVMLSQRPEYNDKIKAHFGLAPVAFMKNLFSPLIRIVSKFEMFFKLLFELFDKHELFPKQGLVPKTFSLVCGLNGLTKAVCVNSFFAWFGFDHKQFNNTILPMVLAEYPSGTSTKQLFHYWQLINVHISKFRQYNHGLLGNLKKYGRLTPPEYNLNNTKVPTFLFYAKNDWLSAIEDVEKLYVMIGSKKRKMVLVDDPKFNHIDYMFASDGRRLVYEPILYLMRSFDAK